ncbi:helix-turn-helix domain-containing protein [Anaerotignum sp. MB30-C6]|uniref:helix-turn-helix domain-containing protein n=1 Tax=Anaerotignum sp. MB30-C6 TaxID=3070814 RepID=UPI0027DC4013|nr:helix-turn-helix transcriptional regulator [Anaerotignum sp. MB30-C6]WMI80950.1 helix-turn-helix transcriptional regulator [Anaerotignum sp. MB30-C6]
MLEKIKAWCRDNKTSVCALEKQCGLGNGTIGGWEKSTPRVDSLIAVSKATGLSIDDLIGQAVVEKE